MRQRFGALLCLITGSILILGGLGAGAGGTVGIIVPPPGACGATVQAGVIPNPGSCPTGEIDLTEATVVTANPGVDTTMPWHVVVSAVGDTPCNLPASGTSKDVLSGGTVSFTGLFIYGSTDPADVTPCQYAIAETPVVDFTATFDPVAPYSFTYLPPIDREAVRPNALPGPSPLAVTLTNTAVAASTTAAPSSTPSTSPAPSSTAVTSPSSPATTGSVSTPVSASASGVVASTGSVAQPTSAAAFPVTANTGPRSPVRGSLIAGIALVALGLVLLLAGRRRARPQHGRS